MWGSQSPPYYPIEILKDFKSSDEMLLFLNSIPKAEPKTIIFNENCKSDFVFVIPTSDFNNTNSINLRKSIGDIPTIFMEASGPYFNYSHSCNVGIETAIQKGYKWIIVCNDDIILEEEISKLKDILDAHQSPSVMTASNREARYHGESFSVLGTKLIILPFILYRYLWRLGNRRNQIRVVLYLFLHIIFAINNLNFVVSLRKDRIGISKYLTPMVTDMINFSDFGIFHKDIISHYKFDENFWNGNEDYALVTELRINGIRVEKIDFKVLTIGGASLGKGVKRRYLGLLNDFYFSYKMRRLIESNIGQK